MPICVRTNSRTAIAPRLHRGAVPARRLGRPAVARGLATGLLLLLRGGLAAGAAARLDRAGGVSAVLRPPLALRLGHGPTRVDDPRAVSGPGAARLAGSPRLPTVGRCSPTLNIGVTIFFLISGFLLYRPFIAHRAGGAAAPSVGPVREAPPAAHLPRLLAGADRAGDRPRAHRRRQRRLVGSVRTRADPALAGCVRLQRPRVDCGLTQTWSLVVEVTFYAALPLCSCSPRRARAWAEHPFLDAPRAAPARRALGGLGGA